MHQISQVSIVVPAYQEKENIRILHEKLHAIFLLSAERYNFDILFVDDGSTDDTWQEMKRLCEQDARVQGIRLSRNFGHQAALTAGFDEARGDIIISLDADLQDPPEIIPEMLKQWELGNEIVYARHTKRHEGWLKKWTAIAYYRILSWISYSKMPENVGDFRLIDRKVLLAFRTLREKDRYIRGMFVWLGFKTGFVDFDRMERQFGTTGYSWKKMLKLAADGIFNFSVFPIKIPAMISGILFLIGVPFVYFYTYLGLVGSGNHVFWEWLSITLVFLIGLQFLCLWIIGEYIARIHNEVRGRPIYIVAERVGE